MGAVYMDRFGDVSKAHFSERLEFDSIDLAHCIMRRLGEKNFIAPGGTCHPGGDVDRRT